MDVYFPLEDNEIKNRRDYLNGGKTYFDAPMSIWEFENLDTDIKERYENVTKYHEVISANFQENTIMDPGNSGNFIMLVRHARYSLPLIHNHRYIEVIYVYKGECKHFIDNEVLEMKTGDLCILAPETMHAVSATNDDAIVINIMLSKKLFDNSFMKMLQGEKVISRFFENIFYNSKESGYLLYHTEDDKWIHDTIGLMVKEDRSREYLFQNAMLLYLKQLFIHLIRRYQMKALVSDSLSHSPNKKIVGVMGYIAKNYNHITLQETAEYFGYSQFYLSQLIQRYVGKSFTAFVKDLQIENAKKLLKETNRSITDISNEIGCYDSSHFTKKFKSAVGVTPNEYRKKQD